MHEVPETFGSRKFCGFRKFPKIYDFQKLKSSFWTWNILISFIQESWCYFFDILLFFPSHVVILCFFFVFCFCFFFFLSLWKVYAPVISDFGQKLIPHETCVILSFTKIYPKIFAKFSQKFLPGKVSPPLPWSFFLFFRFICC